MNKIEVLNIPNYYASYYLLGFDRFSSVSFIMDSDFVRYNNTPVLILKINNSIVVIDNDDPTGLRQELYEVSTLYFVTNKLLDNDLYKQPKIRSLYPHYPVNIAGVYWRTFGFSLFRYMYFKEVFRQFYILLRRPIYQQYKERLIKENFVFFSSNIWKNEPDANHIRAEFIRFCKAYKRIIFKGGFVPRSDKNNLGFDNELNTEKYSPRVFSKLSASSKIVLNNPAVCGAVSWRLAEYLNQGLFVLSFPFKVNFPVDMIHENAVHLIHDTDQFKTVFNHILDHPEYHEMIARKGKLFFNTFCTPEAQVNYIMQQVLRCKFENK